MLSRCITSIVLAVFILCVDSSPQDREQSNDSAATTLVEASTLTAGSLDPTFGQGGAAFLTVPSYWLNGCDTTVQNDGKALVVGRYAHSSGDSFAVIRFNSDGSLDLPFSAATAATSIFRGEAKAVAIQPDQKILAAGHELYYAAAIARLLPDGRLDPAFGQGGRVKLSLGTPGENKNIWSLAILPSGKIIAVSEVYNPSAGDRFKYDMLVIQLLPDGSPDTSFGSGGIKYIDFGQSSFARDVKVQANGRIVLAGESSGRFALARLMPDGSLDEGFGTRGLVLTPITQGSRPHAYCQAIDLTNDGGVVAVGGSDFATDTDELTVVKYTHLGTLDSGFGTSGIVRLGQIAFNIPPQDIMVQPDGKVLVVHSEAIPNARYAAAVRLSPTGQLDSTFGKDGRVRFGSKPSEFSRMSMQADGKVVATGTYANGTMMVFRFLTDLESDLASAIKADDIVNRGKDFEIILRVRNGGAFPVNPVRSAVRITGGEIKRIRAAVGTCSLGDLAGTIGCDFGTLDAGAQVAVVITVNAKRVLEVRVSALSVGPFPDPDQSNNLAQKSIQVRGP
ncbi:MAG: hypothetical protein EXR52_01165 [Dehalococcoidia bacterium]|nr:hypothetical protein [Dehalococcoidia bacterium]